MSICGLIHRSIPRLSYTLRPASPTPMETKLSSSRPDTRRLCKGIGLHLVELIMSFLIYSVGISTGWRRTESMARFCNALSDNATWSKATKGFGGLEMKLGIASRNLRRRKDESLL